MLSIPLNGGCQCGNIRYQISTDPLTLYCCHCTDCQKQSASAFGMSLWCPPSGFKLEQGKLAQFVVTADSGNKKYCSFCPDCGCRIYHAGNADPDYLSIKAGTLDDIGKIKPVARIWVSSALPWSIPIDDPLPKFDQDVEDKIVLKLWDQAKRP